MRIHPVFHVSLLEKYFANKLPGRVVPPPPPLVVDGSEEFEVEKILDSRMFRGRLQYLVKWKGYSVKDNTWQSPDDCSNAPDLVAAFHASHPTKPGSSRR
ncbi:MAG: chromo domain-containing protein [Oligoflexia bacterium]